MWYVYILKSLFKKWYYVGSTNRPKKRLAEHNAGRVFSTKAYRPFEVIFQKEFKAESEARNYERLLKDKKIEKERIIRMFEKSS